MLDEPWAHAARRVELDGILRTAPENSFERNYAAVGSKAWECSDALRRGDMGELPRLLAELYELDPADYLERWKVFYEILAFGEIREAAHQIISWHADIDLRDLDNDNTNRTNARVLGQWMLDFVKTPAARFDPAYDEISLLLEKHVAQIRSVVIYSFEQEYRRYEDNR